MNPPPMFWSVPWRCFPRGTIFCVSGSIWFILVDTCVHKRWVGVCFCMYTVYLCSVCRLCVLEQSLMIDCLEIKVTPRRCKVLGSAVVHGEAGLFSATQDEGFISSEERTHSQVWELAPPLVEIQKCYCKVFFTLGHG